MQPELPEPAWRPRSGPRTNTDQVASKKALSWSYPRSHWDSCAGSEPILIGAKFDSEPAVMDPEIAITPARDCIGLHRLHLLRDDADVSLVAARIAKSIVAKPVLETTEQDDVVLQPQIGPPAAAAPAATSANTTTSSSAASTPTTEPASAPCRHSSASTTSACTAGSTARGPHMCCAAR